MQTGRLHVRAKFHLKVFIVSASSVQKPQFWANFDFWGLLYRPPITDEGQIWCATAVRTSTLTYQISSECVHRVAFRWPKTTFIGKLLNFRGLLYRLPFTDKGQIWCPEADRTSTLTCQVSSESVHCVGFQWPKPQFGANFDFGGLLYRPPITD